MEHMKTLRRVRKDSTLYHEMAEVWFKLIQKKAISIFPSSSCLSPEMQITKQINLASGTFYGAVQCSCVDSPFLCEPFLSFAMSLRRLLRGERMPFGVAACLFRVPEPALRPFQTHEV